MTSVRNSHFYNSDAALPYQVHSCALYSGFVMTTPASV